MAKLTPNKGLHGAKPSQVSQWNSYNVHVDGAFPKAPTNASTQASGTGTLVVRCNLSTGVVFIADKSLTVNVSDTGADYSNLSCHNAATMLLDGQSAVFHVLAYENKGTGAIVLKAYYGDAATTGSQVGLSEAELSAKPELLNNSWVELGRFSVNRTADTTVTQTGYSYLYRPAGNRTAIE